MTSVDGDRFEVKPECFEFKPLVNQTCRKKFRFFVEFRPFELSKWI